MFDRVRTKRVKKTYTSSVAYLYCKKVLVITQFPIQIVGNWFIDVSDVRALCIRQTHHFFVK